MSTLDATGSPEPVPAPTPGISGHHDPAGEAPWALPLVVRVEKHTTATHEAVCAAAARAVVLLLADPRSQPGGPWHPAITRWQDGRIRKVVRRARASRWDATSTLDHVTVTDDGATVRAFVPTATDQVPDVLRRLQVSGLDLPTRSAAPVGDDTANDTLDASSTGMLDDLGRATVPQVVVALTPHLRLSTGKAAAQAAHAAQLSAAALPDDVHSAWVGHRAPLHVTFPDADAWASIAEAAPVQIRDAGFTEIPPNSLTAVAWTCVTEDDLTQFADDMAGWARTSTGLAGDLDW